MTETDFSIKLKEKFPDQLWSPLNLALRQDERVWQALCQTSLGDQALSVLPAELDHWSPAVLALLDLGYLEQVESLSLSPLQPLDQTMLEIADSEYRKWIDKDLEHIDLSQAGLLALALRERFRLKGSWKDVLTVYNERPLAGETILACLYGFIPDPFDLVRSINNLIPKADSTDLILHILLSNPLTAEAQSGLFSVLLSEFSVDKSLQFLQKVSLQRPWQLSRLMQDLIRKGKEEEKLQVKDDTNQLSNQFDSLADKLRLAQIYELASQPEESVSLLADMVKSFRHLRGQISAQLARVITNTRYSGDKGWQETALETSTDAWKQAIKLVPESDDYAAGLANNLINAGKLKDAQAYLQAKGLSAESEVTPVVSLTQALIADRLDDKAQAKNLAQQTLAAVKEGQKINRDEYIALGKLFSDSGMLQQVVETTKIALHQFPTDQDLLNMQAAAYTKLGQPEEAISSIFTSLSVNSAGMDKEAGKNNSDISLQSLLVENFEAIKAWQPALKERLKLLAAVSDPPQEDYIQLAVCANNAGEPKQAITACEKVLKFEPDNIQAHCLLADALIGIENFKSASEHYNQAVQLAPEQSENWIALAKSYQMMDRPTEVVDTLRTASQVSPDDAQIHLSLGEVYLAQGMPTQALASLKRAYHLSIEEKISLRLGQTLLKLGHFEEALQILERAYESAQQSSRDPLSGEDSSLEISPELIYAYGRALLGVGEFSKAISILGTVVRTQPENPAPCLDLARALLLLNDQPAGSQRAVPFLNCIIAFDEEGIENIETDNSSTLEQIQAEAYVLLAQAFENVGDLEQSMDTYRQALGVPSNQVSDRRARISLGLGRVALKLDQPETAIAALQEVAVTEPLNATAQRSLSEAFLASELAPESFQAACAALELKPSDLGMLAWFAEHGKKLYQFESAKNLPIQEEVIRALQAATKIAPERLDLVAQLGEMLSENGQRSEALQVYQKLAKFSDEKLFLPADELYRVSKSLRELGDGQLAATILKKAIDDSVSDSLSKDSHEAQIISDLYAELAYAYQQIDESHLALSTLENAIALNPNNVDFLKRKVEILFNQSDYQAAHESLKKALRLEPNNVELQYLMGFVLQVMGYLPAALSHAEQALEILEGIDTPKSKTKSKLSIQAAELSYLLLQPERAKTHLEKVDLQSESSQIIFRGTCLHADLAFDNGNLKEASQAFTKMSQVHPDHPRCRAARSLLSCLEGDRDAGIVLLRSVFIDLDDGNNNKFENADRLEKVLSLLAITKAAMGLELWEEALSLVEQLIEHDPHEPLSYMRLSQMLVLRAEARQLCQDFSVRDHIVDLEALSDEACIQFKHAIMHSEEKMGNQSAQSHQKTKEWWENEASRMIELWKSRGQAAFNPNLQTAGNFKKVLKAVAPKADDIATLMMALRKSGVQESAVSLMQMDWHPSFVGSEIAGHPLVLTQLALALEETKPEQALEIAHNALERVEDPEAIQFPQPAMLNYLLARISYQLEENKSALQYIEAAITTWNNEAIWHTLAAQICLINDPSTNLPDPEKALYHLAYAADLMPEYAPTHLSLGRVYIEQGETELAVEALEKASQLEPKNGQIWFLLSKAQQELGDYEAAVFSIDLAIERLDEPFQAQLLRAELEVRLDNPGDAFNRIQLILNEKPDHPQALLLLSQVLEKLDRPAEALEALEKAMSLDTDKIPMKLERFRLIKRSKGLTVALKELDEEVVQNPKQPELMATLAEWLLEAGKRDLAIQAARVALQAGAEGLQNSTLANLHFLIGQQMREAGQLDQAIDHFSKTIRYSPDVLEPYLELGGVHQARREYKQALKVYQKAIDAADADYRPYYFAGQVLKDNKDYLAAEAMLRRATQLAPNEIGVHRLLGAVVALNLIHNRRLAPTKS